MKVTLLLPFVALVSAVAIKSAAPPVPEIQELPQITRKDTTVKRVRYGPYKLAKAVGTAADPKGVKTTIMVPGVKKPCSDCTLILMNGGTQFADGTEATTAGGVYLHHAAMLNSGAQVRDGNCNTSPVDLFFSTGNERSPIIYNNPNATVQAGYYIGNKDNFVLESEVINNALVEQNVYIYFNYEYIPGKQPGFQNTKTIWLSTDAKPCGSKAAANPLDAGNFPAPNEKSFTLTSLPWVSPWNGNLVALGGHIHDGGVNTEIYQNGKLLCNSQAHYGVGDGASMGGHHGGTGATKRLLSMTGCVSSDRVNAGDKFHIVVKYDFEQYPGMRDEKGKLMPIMAAATLFIGADPK